VNCYRKLSIQLYECRQCGVLRGFVMGPVLCMLFINDINRVCSPNTKLKLFADDLTLYNVIDIAIVL
jgi:hypothetical protein